MKLKYKLKMVNCHNNNNNNNNFHHLNFNNNHLHLELIQINNKINNNNNNKIKLNIKKIKTRDFFMTAMLFPITMEMQVLDIILHLLKINLMANGMNLMILQLEMYMTLQKLFHRHLIYYFIKEKIFENCFYQYKKFKNK